MWTLDSAQIGKRGGTDIFQLALLEDGVEEFDGFGGIGDCGVLAEVGCHADGGVRGGGTEVELLMRRWSEMV